MRDGLVDQRSEVGVRIGHRGKHRHHGSDTDVHLTDEALDRIDQIVAPGLTLNPADNGRVSPALDPTARRR
jgi:hypothetical protein